MRIPEPDPWAAADLDRLVRELEEEMRRPDPPPPAPTCSGMSVTDREPERERTSGTRSSPRSA